MRTSYLKRMSHHTLPPHPRGSFPTFVLCFVEFASGVRLQMFGETALTLKCFRLLGLEAASPVSASFI